MIMQRSAWVSVLFVGLAASAAALAQPPGAGPTATPTKLRSVPAETTAAAVRDPSWKPPHTSWGDPSFEGVWSVDDMRGIPRERPKQFGTRRELTPDEFLQRAERDQAGRDRAVNTETFLRNEFGVRSFGYTSLIVDPPNGRMPELTADGKARAQAVSGRGTFGPGPFNTFEDFTLYDRCITRGIFGAVLPSIYGNGIRIAQSPGAVSITYEMIHETRIIPLDGRAPVSGAVRQYSGLGRGHFEGDTLVVEASNFTDKTSVGGRELNSKDLKLVETYRRVDPNMIEYHVTVDDPKTFTAPFTYRIMITSQPNYEVYEYSCHEGNGAVKYALSGERAYEKQVAEAVAKGEPIPRRSSGLNVYRAPEKGAEVYDINAGE